MKFFIIFLLPISLFSQLVNVEGKRQSDENGWSGTIEFSFDYNDSEKIDWEFNNTSHLRGTVSMARTNAPDSANSQFFICFGSTPHLDGQYTVFGQVVKGMEFIDGLKKGSGGGGEVTDPDKMISVKVVADI